MNPATDPPPVTERGLSLYVASWVAAGVGVTVATAAASWPAALDWPLMVVLWAGFVAAALLHVPVRVRGTREASNFVEVATVPVMILLEPPVALLVGGTAALVAEVVLTHGQVRKWVFNCSWQLVAIAAGSWVFHLAAGDFGPRPGWLELGAAAVSGMIYVSVNTFAFTGIVALRSRRSWRSVLGEELPASTVIDYGTAMVGVLAAVLIVTAPLALPLLALPVLWQRGRAQARSEGYDQLAVERERLRRTVEGSSDGVVLLDRRGHVEVWNPAMERLTGLAGSEASGATLTTLDLENLLGDESNGAGHRTALRGRTVEVRRAPSGPVPSPTGSVLSVRDVTRQAELAQIREDLVSRVSHELRTPLTTLSGFLEVLRTRWDQLDEPRRRELVEVCDRGAQRLSTLVADLMAWARIESREREPAAGQSATCTVAEVLELLGATDCAPHAQFLEEGHRVSLSATELRRVLQPLLANAHAHGAPPVIVNVERHDDTHQIVVRDHGPGLPADRAEALFDAFAQGTLGLQRTESGLGLGLAIARGTAELAGGSLAYEADDGTAFVVTLPQA